MSDENYLLTNDCHGPAIKRAALDRLLAAERIKALEECHGIIAATWNRRRAVAEIQDLILKSKCKS